MSAPAHPELHDLSVDFDLVKAGPGPLIVVALEKKGSSAEAGSKIQRQTSVDCFIARNYSNTEVVIGRQTPLTSP